MINTKVKGKNHLSNSLQYPNHFSFRITCIFMQYSLPDTKLTKDVV